jgi:nicotinamide-nucleotide amidase
LSQVEGAGEVLEGSFVVYSKAHKTRALGVDEDLLRRQGAIKAATAEQMVAGALTHSRAGIALAVTGVLGPSPDEDGNPVGLVYISGGWRGRSKRTQKHEYGHQPHDALRHQAIYDALTLLDGLLREHSDG